MIKINRLKRGLILSILSVALSLCGCKKLVEVDAPPTSITDGNAFNTDATAVAVLTGIYTKITSTFASGTNGVSLISGLSSDEFTLWNGINTIKLISYYRNNLSVSNGGFEFWNTVYPYIFSCNSAIEGLNKSTSLTPSLKSQLLGESKFMRAFFYFYLVNWFGDVPLVLSTDYTVNGVMSRTPKALVYEVIINDLKDAQALLSDKYLMSDAFTPYLVNNEERVRPTKWAATALLARAYLYSGYWVEAEAQATLILNNSTAYSLQTNLNNVFLKNNHEAIWQLQSTAVGANTADAVMFMIPTTGLSSSRPVYLSNQILNSFEIGDQRKTIGNWINSTTIGSTTYYYPYKYKATIISNSATEHLMVLRLAEQYLIRAEARAQQDNLSGAANDLNVIRTRAGLPNATATTQSVLLTAILNERQVEFFSEWGHRWFDLKRTGNVDAVMSIATPIKSNGNIQWNSYQQLYPLPLIDIERDKNLRQNSGY